MMYQWRIVWEKYLWIAGNLNSINFNLITNMFLSWTIKTTFTACGSSCIYAGSYNQNI